MRPLTYTHRVETGSLLMGDMKVTHLTHFYGLPERMKTTCHSHP